MDTTIIKANLLDAMKTVHNEYKTEIHSLNMSTCAMCKLYRDESKGSCTICPMGQAFRSCGSRKCIPISCIDSEPEYDCYIDNREKRLEAVTEFYARAIIEIEKLSETELQNNHLIFLRDIDNSVAEEMFGFEE